MSWGSDMRVWIPSMETGHIHPCISLDGYKTRTPNLGSPERMQLFVLYTIFNQNLFSDEWNQKVCGWLKKIHTHHIYTCSHITQSHTHNTYMHIPHTQIQSLFAISGTLLWAELTLLFECPRDHINNVVSRMLKQHYFLSTILQISFLSANSWNNQV